MKKKFSSPLLWIGICFLAFAMGCAPTPFGDYGVFLGINGYQTDQLAPYRVVVIEPSEFAPEQVARLQAEGKTVYGYLNIGAIETYRTYYDRFQGITLGVYEDWPDEKWVDVSAPAWQQFLVEDLGKAYAEMGLDGFFLDNADVYYHYPTQEMFEGLSAILKGLRSYDLTLILNGGDAFVSRCLDEGIAPSLFDGVNQETVFTRIHFETRTFGKQKEDERLYFQNYLAQVKSAGLSVYLLEYGADQALAKEIDAYCPENGFLWYNARDLDLR